jgi:hypothetical protein
MSFTPEKSGLKKEQKTKFQALKLRYQTLEIGRWRGSDRLGVVVWRWLD